jgi:hypothetical protein
MQDCLEKRHKEGKISEEKPKPVSERVSEDIGWIRWVG